MLDFQSKAKMMIISVSLVMILPTLFSLVYWDATNYEVVDEDLCNSMKRWRTANIVFHFIYPILSCISLILLWIYPNKPHLFIFNLFLMFPLLALFFQGNWYLFKYGDIFSGCCSVCFIELIFDYMIYPFLIILFTSMIFCVCRNNRSN